MLDIEKKRYGFSRKYRLNSKKSIDRLFRKGKFKSVGFLKFRYLQHDDGYCRVVISISKRVGSAPERNRLKRLIREAARLTGRLQNTSVNLAVFVTKPLQKRPTLAEVQGYSGQFFKYFPDESK